GYQYTVSDGNGGNAVGTVVVNLAEVNDSPVAADDSLGSTAEDTALHISFASLLGNDTDADSHNAQWGGTNDVLTVTVVGNAVHGTVALVNGEVVFTPDANYHGPASFAYEVSDSQGAVSQALATFSVTAVNDAPVAVGETIISSEDTDSLIIHAALLQNDSDVDIDTDGQVLRITAVSNFQHGTGTLNANGTISFVPDANYYGNASFDYTLSDGNGGTATATATIALTHVNDAPVATGETYYGDEDQEVTFIASRLLDNDSDIDNAHAGLNISRVQSGTGGTVRLNADGNVVFTPTQNYNGNATFTYWVKDPGGLESNAATVTMVLAPVNDAPSVQGFRANGAFED
ncbi:MAG: tandem-95 repeat protein, partial [Rhodoferax sp.]|nr:tandem-95 repeat protein [Rhodoferax sp.]